MSDSKAEGSVKSSVATLSASEMKSLSVAISQCLLNPDALKIDTKKFAELNGYKNTKVASTMWSALKRKLLAASPTASSSACVPAKGASGTNCGDDDEEETEIATKPATKKRTRAPKNPNATPRKRVKKAPTPQFPPTPTSDGEAVKKEDSDDEIAAQIDADEKEVAA